MVTLGLIVLMALIALADRPGILSVLVFLAVAFSFAFIVVWAWRIAWCLIKLSVAAVFCLAVLAFLLVTLPLWLPVRLWRGFTHGGQGQDKQA